MDANEKDTAYLDWLEKEYFAHTNVKQMATRPPVPPAPIEAPTIHLLAMEPVTINYPGLPWVHPVTTGRWSMKTYKWIIAGSSLLTLGIIGFSMLWNAFK